MNHHGHHIEDVSENIELMHSALRVHAESAGFQLRQILDATKVRMCLEATGGLVEAAAEMYWDDFLARQALAGQHNDDDYNMEGNNDEADDVAARVVAFPPRPQLAQPVRLVAPRGRGYLLFSGVESSLERIRSATLAAQIRRRLLLRNSRRIRRANRRKARVVHEQGEESIISDDEGVVQSRKIEAQDDSISSSTKRRKTNRKETDLIDEDEDDAGYISDSDWLWTTMVPREGDQVQVPSDFLWGSSDGEVPATWINAGLKVSKIGAVLLRPPNDDDFGYSKWKDRSVQGIPAPYHCRSISLVTSLVTALLYSGVGVQPGPCIAVGRQPLIEIVEKLEEMNPNETRKRLVDVLTTLLHIAATSSAERKRKALESMLHHNPRKWQRIHQKLKLVPIYTIPTTADTLSYEISFTNIQDLKSYVDSAINSFTGSGGVAMLLDLIVAIHGVSALRRMGKKNEFPSIIKCTCAQRFVPPDKEAVQKLKSQAKHSPKLDTSPRDLNCIGHGNNLLGLLLTGRLNATKSQLEDACKTLGLGIISEDDEMPSLSSAKVWLVHGPTQWSVLLWRSGDFQHEHPVGEFLHLNLWYGEENSTRMQLSMRGSPNATHIDRTPLIVHNGDQKFYPQKYRLWRYKFSATDDWRSYHLLEPEEQRVVEDTVGPRLAVLLRRQWPCVTIDNMATCDPAV